VRDNVITNNGVFDCTECHSYLKTNETNSTAPTPTPADYRHAAPIGANFDGATDLTAYNNITADAVYEFADGAGFSATTFGFADNNIDRLYEVAADFLAAGYMPMDPTADSNADNVTEDSVDAADLSGADQATMLNWALQGAPYKAPEATTDAATSVTKVAPSNHVSATLNATINTNVHSGTAVPGTYYYEYEEEIEGAAIGSYDLSTTPVDRSSTDTTSSAGVVIDNLICGRRYNFRAVATNGSGTAYGSNMTLDTPACQNPVVAGVTIVADETSQSTDEETSVDFALTVSNIDPGSLKWSKTNGAKGTVTLSNATQTPKNGSATVTYMPSQDQNGADSFTVTVTNFNSGASTTITFNMTIDPVNDQPAFAVTSIPSTSAIEDTLYTYQLEIEDPDDDFSAGLSASLSNEPAGMSVDADGLVTWTPVNGVASSGLVTVNVQDGLEDGTVQISQQFTIIVSATNDPPVITPGATTTATEDVEYSYQVQVTDIDDINNGTDISFSLTGEPAGMSISSTGLITWTPLEGITTSGLVTVSVEDGDEDASAPDTESFTIMVTQVNDPPVVTPGAPTAMTENDSFSYQIVVNDDDDINNGTDLSFTPSNFPPGMSVSTTGLITWAAPRTGSDVTHNNITVTVADGGEDGAATSAEVFDLTVSIVDTDGDTVADYSDNCPDTANPGQQDLDNDTARILPQTDPNNFPPEGDVDPTARDPENARAESYLRGGDACDEDIDGDGMSNDFENSFAFLNPLDASDAVADEDGDGVPNLDEFLAGTQPDVDSVGPAVTAPADITVNARGLFTHVDLGTPGAVDGNEGEATLFKAAVNLSDDDKLALDTPVTGCQLFKQFDEDIGPFRPGRHVITWATCDSNGNSGRDDQIVNVKPIASVRGGQYIGEGQQAIVQVMLNGNAPEYPATVEYTLSGTATANEDYTGAPVTVSFDAPGDIATISIDIKSDAIVESDETIIVSLNKPSNMVLSKNKVHTITITEANVAPTASLSVTQPSAVLDVNKGNTVYVADGVVQVIADARDANGDSLSYNWGDSDNSIKAVATVSGNMIEFDPAALTAGVYYPVSVTVSDGSESVTTKRLLLVSAGEVNVWLTGDDDDGDGVDNLDEGYGDDDADGIPNYLDNNQTPSNAIENQTANLDAAVYIETNPGLSIKKGETAVAAGASGILIGLQDIRQHGGPGGTPVSNAGTDYTFLSSLLSFEVHGLDQLTEKVDVVIPLSAAIQQAVVFRKYNETGWFDFIEDDMNKLSSAKTTDGTCPPAGSSLYRSGLNVGDLCLQLTIQDGGANDADGVRNFVVKDPGGLALEPEPQQEEVVDPAATADGRIGSVSLWAVFCMALLAGWLSRSRVAVTRQ